MRSIEASYSQEERIWSGNDGPPTKMRVLFAMISWCNQTAGFTAQARCHGLKRVALSSCSTALTLSRCALTGKCHSRGRGQAML